MLTTSEVPFEQQFKQLTLELNSNNNESPETLAYLRYRIAKIHLQRREFNLADVQLAKALITARDCGLKTDIIYELENCRLSTVKPKNQKTMLKKLSQECLLTGHLKWYFHFSLDRVKLLFSLNESVAALNVLKETISHSTQGEFQDFLGLLHSFYLIKTGHFSESASILSTVEPLNPNLGVYKSILLVVNSQMQKNVVEAIQNLKNLQILMEKNQRLISSNMTFQLNSGSLTIQLFDLDHLTLVVYWMSGILYQTIQPSKSIKYFQEALKLSDSTMKPQILKQLFYCSISLGTPADDLLKEFIESSDDQLGICYCYALYNHSIGNRLQSKEWFMRCLAFECSPEVEFSCLLHLLLIASSNEEETHDLVYRMEHLKVFNDAPLSVFNGIRETNAGNMQKSKQFLLDALDISQKLQSNQILGISISMLASIYSQTQPEHAKKMLKAATEAPISEFSIIQHLLVSK